MAFQDKAVSNGSSGNDDIRATNDVDGTLLQAGAGDDILRGGKYDDVLVGGSGNDQMFGGDGADQFRFFGSQIDGASDSDRIYDLDFSEGDTLVFGNYAAGTFVDDDGVNGFTLGTAASISSWEGVVNAVDNSALVTASRQSIYNDNLILSIDTGAGQVQNLVITGGYSAYVAAGGTEGVII